MKKRVKVISIPVNCNELFEEEVNAFLEKLYTSHTEKFINITYNVRGGLLFAFIDYGVYAE
jgi:hypothetical protein